MSEADILSIRNELTGLVVSVVSVSFGMISAYIAGLWLFLREAPISLRLLAFALLSCGLAFMGALTLGLNDLVDWDRPRVVEACRALRARSPASATRGRIGFTGSPCMRHPRSLEVWRSGPSISRSPI